MRYNLTYKCAVQLSRNENQCINLTYIRIIMNSTIMIDANTDTGHNEKLKRLHVVRAPQWLLTYSYTIWVQLVSNSPQYIRFLPKEKISQRHTPNDHL